MRPPAGGRAEPDDRDQELKVARERRLGGTVLALNPTIMRCYEARVAEIDAAWMLVEDGLVAMPPPLAALGRRWLARIGGDRPGEAPHRAYFSTSFAPPLVYLPLWLRERLHADDPEAAPTLEATVGIVAATMWGYFYIRIQDDLLDESTSDRAFTLLGNACLLAMIQALDRWVGRAPGFAEVLSRSWMDFTCATLAEHEQLLSPAPYSSEAFREHGRKVAFARVPLNALCALAGRKDLDADLEALVHALGVAYGLTNDVWGWPRDLVNGHRTFLLARAGLDAGERGSVLTERIAATLHRDGILVDTLEEAIEAIGRAASIAERLGLAAFAQFSAERRLFLQDMARRMRLLRLRSVLRTSAAEVWP